MKMTSGLKKYKKTVDSLMKSNGYHQLRNNKHRIYQNDLGDKVVVSNSPKMSSQNQILKRIGSDLRRNKTKRSNNG